MDDFLVYDIESDGLYDDFYKKNATQMWCLCLLDSKKYEYVFVNDARMKELTIKPIKGKRSIFPLSQFKAWFAKKLKEVKAVICHNQLDYDLKIMKKFLDIDYHVRPDSILGHKIEIIDTLLDSKWLNPKRALPWGCPASIKPSDGGKSKIIGPHGLEAWGYRVSKKKPAIDDWEGLPIDDYVNRCIEDIHINYGTFRLLNSEIAKYFNGPDDMYYWKVNRNKARLPISIEHAFKQDIIEQKQNGVPLNKKEGERLVKKFDKELEELRQEIESHLPHIPIPPSRLPEWKFPARAFKQDKKLGAVPSAHLEKFCAKHNGKVWKEESDWYVEIEVEGEKKKYKAPFPDYIKTTEQMTVESEHLPQYIIDTYGWKPMYWNYQIDPKTKRKARDKNKQLIPTTPRFKDAATGRLCPHLESLEVSFIKKVLRYRTIKHRRQTILSYTNDTKGYLNHPRLAIDGRLPADMDTLGAATSRVTHKVVCNVPKADDDVLYGQEMRSLFWTGGDPDWFFIGWDASGLEARLEGSEAAKYDNGEYANILMTCDIHEINAAYFDIKRGQAKSVKYGLGYGAGVAKIAQMLDVSPEKAALIIEDWWEKYWSVKKVIDALEKEWKATGKKYIKGIDGRPIMMNSAHTALNYRLQNAGTVAMKLHSCILRKDPKIVQWKKDGLIQKVIDYHDEAQWLVHKSLVKFTKVSSKEEGEKYFLTKGTTKPFKKKGHWWVGYCELGKLGCEAITKAGEVLKLRVKLTGDYQIGRSWADTH